MTQRSTPKNYIAEVLANPAKHPRTFIIFTVIIFGVLTTGLSNLILSSLGKFLEAKFKFAEVYWNLAVVSICLLIILIGLSNLPNWLQSLRQNILKNIQVESNTAILDDTGREITFPGLVVAMSVPIHGRQTVAERSILHHWLQGKGNLGHCWLICSDTSVIHVATMIETLQSEGVNIRIVTQNEDKLLPKAGTRQINLYYSEMYELENPSGFMPKPEPSSLSLLVANKEGDDPNEIRQLVEAIYLDVQSKGLEETDVIVDYTSGTKSFTAGIVLACAGASRRLQYISQNTNKIMEVVTAYQIRPARKG
jgi:hypothetical protein